MRSPGQPDSSSEVSARVQVPHPLLGISKIDSLGLSTTWSNTFDASKLLFLLDQHIPLPGSFPAAGYVKMVAEASLKVSGSRILRKFELDDFFIEKDITLTNGEDKIQISLEFQTTGSHERNGDRTDFINFRIRTCSAGTTKLNALGCLRLRSSDRCKGQSLANDNHHQFPPTRHDNSNIPVNPSTTIRNGADSSSTPASQVSARSDKVRDPEEVLSSAHKPLAQDAQSVVDDASNQLVSTSTSPVIIKTLPMSFGQSGFWFMNEFIGDPTFFNGTVSFLITTNLDIDKLSRVVHDMGRRHEGLRTAFFTDNSHQPKQGVLAEPLLFLETKKMTSPGQVRTEIDAMNRHVYDIARGETLRLLLLTESSNCHHLIVGYHHINIDGMSIMAITDNLRMAYDGSDLPPPFQQNDFAERQRERLRTGKYANDVSFWKSEFKELPDILPILPLSPNTLRSRPTARTTYRHVRAERRLSPSITAKLQELRKQGHIQSPFNFYVTVFQILLGRLAHSEDICIGVASANRHNDPESTNSIGIFLNLFPLRLQSKLSKSFATLLGENKTKILTGLSHSAVPFDVILDEVRAVRHPSYSPLFQAFVNYIPVRENRPFGDGSMENKEYEIGETMYDIMLAVVDPPTGDPWISIMVQRELYTEHEAQILLHCFMNLMEAFTSDIHLPGRAPQMFNEIAVKNAIKLGQGATLDIELGSLIQPLDAISASHPSRTALKDTNGRILSFADMMTRSFQVAQALYTSGVPSKSRIGVLQEPTVDWICSMLGIWRFSGSYVPLETTQGSGRLKSIINDAQLAVILVHDATEMLCKEIDIAHGTIILDVATVCNMKLMNNFNFYVPEPSDEAIVLYTSGSTGTPKGISLPHRMVTNTILGFLHCFPMKPQTVLQQISLSFDVSWWQSLLGLVTGGTVVVAGRDMRRDPFALTSLIVSEMITLTLAVPSEAMSWLQYGNRPQLQQSAWEWHISAGEEIGSNLVERLRTLQKPDLRFINAYGPAETIVPHAYEVPYRDLNLDSSHIPIGEVLPNYNVYIADEDNHPLPTGVPGQIVIGGAGVASGYINQPELTAARFLKDSLASSRAIANGWIYAHLSGDRGYVQEDGTFVALGRISGNTQVKLRGQRFELREVEIAMIDAGKGDILEAVCHIRRRDETDAATAFLVSHVVVAPEIQKKYGTKGLIIDNILRKIVSNLALPQYMRPSVVISLPSMPLNHHGKVDRKFLSQSSLTKTAVPLRASTSPFRDQNSPFVEEMKDIWRAILGDLIEGEKLDENSDFFLVGGNSLLLIKVQSKLKQRTNRDIPLVSLFEASTLGKMATILNCDPHTNDKRLTRTSSEDRMKQIWLSVLGDIVTEEDVTPEADFFLVGGNSLLLIRIQSEVNKKFDTLLPLAKLFEASTLRGMSILLEVLVTENDTPHSNEVNINWLDEVACKETVLSSKVASKFHGLGNDDGRIVVLLTGATGFLGRHILENLINDRKVKAVHCITVRDTSKALVNSPKVIIHTGDLRDPRLGLSDDTAKHIFSRLSVIIHNGADVSFLRGYKTLRAANLLSTKALVQLSIKYADNEPLPHFHFVSTAGVTQLGTKELYEESLPVLQPLANANGYVVSKWASEKYLENAHNSTALPVTIHRPSYILGPDAPQLDVMHNILHFAQTLRSVPQMPSVDRWLQFVGIDEVAQDIAASVVKRGGSQAMNVQYRNHCGREDDWVRLDQLGPYLERQHGGVFSVVAFANWIDAAGKAGMPTQVKEYLSNLVTKENTKKSSWIYPRVLKGPRNISAPWRRKGKL